MDDLLSDFLTETSESLDVVDMQLVQFEQEPNNAAILDNIFRLVHTIKGTCGFLGLPRLEALAHAAETLMGTFRDGRPVTPDAVSVILVSIDRIKEILGQLSLSGAEPDGGDDDLISRLNAMAGRPPPDAAASGGGLPDDATLDVADPERELKPGEVSLDDLERAFRDTPGPEETVGETADAPAAAPLEEERPDPPVQKQSIRVNVDTIETLMTMVSELVLTRNQLLEMVRRVDDSEFKVPLQRLSNVTAELQEGVMKTRMQPIGNAWAKLPRLVRDLASDLGKKIELEMNGAETELDRQVLELIKDPLTHMVRNSADHGLEQTDERIAAGKAQAGRIRLGAYHQGGHIIIEIADDGKGLNAEALKAKIIENGLASAAELEKMTDAQIHKFIFKAGFSTASEVTSVSGRGVGMDVVRSNIELIGGSIDLKSEPGRGTTFYIKIPLTLAIVSALIVEAGGHRFAVPQLNVLELVRAQPGSDHRIETINETPVLRLRNTLLPLMHLSRLLALGPARAALENVETARALIAAEPGDGEGEGGAGTDETAAGLSAAEESPGSSLGEGFIIVLQVGSQTFGLVVDNVFDTEEIVVKPMSSLLRDVTMFSGNTILGDGSVIMIIDPNGTAQAVHGELAAAVEEDAERSAMPEAVSAETESLLVFRAGSDTPKAVPLSLVTRLEEIDVSTIERSDGRDLVQYRGRLMPLLWVCGESQRRHASHQPVLVFTVNDRAMGLAVDEIVDIVEDELKITVPSEVPGMVGSAILCGLATEIVDVGHYLPQAFDDWMEQEMGQRPAARHLLLVDDSAFFRDLLAPVLKAEGYTVTSVAGAADALRLREAGRHFDVIISDVDMPDMDGFAFAEALKADPAWAAIPVIALAAAFSADIVERGREAGFHEFVAKFDRHGLLAAVREISGPVGVAA